MNEFKFTHAFNAIASLINPRKFMNVSELSKAVAGIPGQSQLKGYKLS
jgi:hypothetical protein